MGSWTYKGNKIYTLHSNVFGFVYKINYTDGSFYIGKKQVVSTKTLPLQKDGSRRPFSTLITKRVNLTKEELEARIPSDKRVSKLVDFEQVRSISNWKTYTGSSKDTANLTIDSKEMLYLVTNNRTLTYLEHYVLFKHNAPCNRQCVNQNIGGKFFDNALDGLIRD